MKVLAVIGKAIIVYTVFTLFFEAVLTERVKIQVEKEKYGILSERSIRVQKQIEREAVWSAPQALLVPTSREMCVINDKGLDLDYGAFELERTLGAVAVSGMYGREPAGECTPCWYPLNKLITEVCKGFRRCFSGCNSLD